VRIVSLLPATTEIVGALGRLNQLVGVTFECDRPTGVRDGRAVVVDTAVPPGLAPGAIDAFVRERVAAGLPVYALDEDRMASLAPDVVLTQDLCRVCALPAEEARRVACGAEVVTFDPHRLGDVLDGIRAVGAAIGAADEAARVVDGLLARLREVGRSTMGRSRPRVLVLEWVDPPFVAGHWVPDVVTAAGADTVLAAPGARSTATTWDAALAEPVDAVLVAPCGFGLDDATAQAEGIRSRFGANVTILAIDAGGCVTRPGPGLVDAVEGLAFELHGVGRARPDVIRQLPV
jgi:iron complex transport system substrate-binding protein